MAVKLSLPAKIVSFPREDKIVVHRVRFSLPTLEGREDDARYAVNPLLEEKHIGKEIYSGKVYCVEVPNRLFLIRRNGVIGITHNTYATATVGLEVLRARYQRFRDQVALWIKKKVIEPICKIQDFYEYRGGERKLIVPDIKWNKINLRDIDSYLSQLMGMTSQEPGSGTGKISDETLFEFLDIDYEDEKRKMRTQLVDELIRQKEVATLGKMSLDELRTLDLNKPIVDLHSEQKEVEPIPGEQAELDEGLGFDAPLGGGGGGGEGLESLDLGLEKGAPGPEEGAPEGPAPPGEAG